MSDPTGRPWHCRQIPNGDEPLVVCERENLLARIAELEERWNDQQKALSVWVWEARIAWAAFLVATTDLEYAMPHEPDTLLTPEHFTTECWQTAVAMMDHRTHSVLKSIAGTAEAGS